jgi:NADH-quinone oxidoreductase subunit J
VVLTGQLGYFFSKGSGEFRIADPTPPPEIGVVTTNTEQVAQVLFSEYLLPFELASILLLVAMIGAIVMAKVRPGAE